MASRVTSVRTAAVVAGLVALGVTEAGDALAQAEHPPEAVSPGDGQPGAVIPGKPVRRARKGKPRVTASAGIVATLPGFEILPDGGSRLFVELTQTATVTERRDARSITYVIHGARVRLRNNENVLETTHFNTPVARARLRPAHGDLVFSVELRADTPATWRLAEGAEGGSSILQIDFPRGAYLPAGEYESVVAGPATP